jgi:cobalt-zinc-cadmium efflux system membrane fusion protein
MTAWITQDRRRFKQRTVKIGLRQNGFDQIEEGLSVGELVVSKGAVFLDNLAAIGAAE